MKKSIHFIFALAATVVIISSSGHARAQEKKEIRRTIIINNSDTIINGKKLRDASPAERKALLKELNESEKNRKERKVIRHKKGDREEKEIIIRDGGKEQKVLRWRSDDDDKGVTLRFDDGPAGMFRFDTDSMVMAFGNDSLMKQFRFKIDGLDSNLRKGVITLNRNFRTLPGVREGSHPRLFMDETEVSDRVAGRRANTQHFNYLSTDKDGIISRMSIRVSEANEETLKKLNVAGKDKSSPGVHDLNFSPNFSSGKLNLSFSLAEKGSVTIKIVDSNFKEIFSDKPSSIPGTYFKQINLPGNGVYYILISQGGRTFVRKIVKE